jgi:hypothetical protein
VQGVFLAVWPRLHWTFAGPLRRFRGIRVEDLGRAMAMNAARDAPGGVEIYEWDGFQRILHDDRANRRGPGGPGATAGEPSRS